MSFGQYVFNQSPANFSEKVLVIDDENLKRKENIDTEFRSNGFEVIDYSDDLSFRVEHETDLKTKGKKMAVFAESGKYVPYDLLKRLSTYSVSMQQLFVDLEPSSLEGLDRTTLDLVVQAYSTNFVKGLNKEKTEEFINKQALSAENVADYLNNLVDELKGRIERAKIPQDWFVIAELKAKIDVLSSKYGNNINTDYVNEAFKEYCLREFGTFSQKNDKESPIIVSRAMEYMHEHSDKFVVIVMDGMSEFDWRVLSDSFTDIVYEKSSVMAMIPSTTSVSRQCLLGGKLPLQLENPWKQDKEKKEFIACAKELGFQDSQIGYERGYEAQFSSFVRCGAIIIMDIDEMVHAQKQGKEGMLQDIELLSRQQKLSKLTKRLLANGYDVYITADHGNTACTGMGHVKGTGVEVETKSRRFLVLKDFADKDTTKEKYGLLEYPKYYLPKENDYLICDIGKSFDVNGEEVMSHGGITIDEVVVPFIKIKAVENNG